MCGITGYIHFDHQKIADKSLLKRMAARLQHRGPDGEGYYCNSNLGLGHRRLSIVDLSTGDQPMYSDDGNFVIIFNGEIYNYIELKAELQALGYKFKTNSDTEVVLKVYQHWGIDGHSRLNGMWAFAIWDAPLKRLVVSRDRLGEKPLFYSIYDNSFVFGSEIKSILEFGVPEKPNHEMLELYLTLSFVPEPFTFYKDIKKLKAGHCLVVNTDGVKEYKYWDLPKIDESEMLTNKEVVNSTFEELLFDATKIRMRCDVPFGAFLSGGLDSASIVALMSEISGLPIQTFTIGFDEKYFDERQLAKLVAKKFNTTHHEYVINHNSFEESIKKVLYHFDEPFGDSSSLPTGIVSQIAAHNVKMVLTGDGGDEVLSGYTPYQGEKFANMYQQLPYFLRSKVPEIIRVGSKLFQGDMRYSLNRTARVLASSNLSFDNRLISKMWCSPELANKLIVEPKDKIKLADFLSDHFRHYPVQDPFYRLMYYHFKVLLPDDYLVKVDRMSMAHSLETRIPFLDYRLVEFMIRVHKDVKMEGFTRKSVLRNTVGKKLPRKLLTTPKKGFGVPLREWFKNKDYEGRLKTLYSTDIGLNTKLIQKIISDNVNGRGDYGNFLWMLFVYKEWLKGND